jgi:WD40 repeat protein
MDEASFAVATGIVNNTHDNLSRVPPDNGKQKQAPGLMALGDDLVLVVGSFLGVQVWLKRRDWKAHTEDVIDCCWSPCGNSYLSCGDDGVLKLWDAASGQLQRATTREEPTGCAYSPDGACLAIVSCDGELGLWDALTHELRSRYLLKLLLPVWIFFTELVATVLIFAIELVVAVLVFLTELVVTVCTDISS